MEFLVLFSNLVEFLHVLEEILTSGKGDEELCLLAISSRALDCDGFGFDLLEGGVVVSR